MDAVASRWRWYSWRQLAFSRTAGIWSRKQQLCAAVSVLVPGETLGFWTRAWRTNHSYPACRRNRHRVSTSQTLRRRRDTARGDEVRGCLQQKYERVTAGAERQLLALLPHGSKPPLSRGSKCMSVQRKRIPCLFTLQGTHTPAPQCTQPRRLGNSAATFLDAAETHCYMATTTDWHPHPTETVAAPVILLALLKHSLKPNSVASPHLPEQHD